MLQYRHRLSGEDGLVHTQGGGVDLHEPQVSGDLVTHCNRQQFITLIQATNYIRENKRKKDREEDGEELEEEYEKEEIIT